MLKIRLTALLILVAGFALSWGVYTTEISKNGEEPAKPFKLGLDLSGGTHLLYRADVSKIPEAEIDDAMSSLRDVIERRVNIFGVSEPVVQVEKSGIGSATREERLIIELPGVTDLKSAVAAIGATPTLDFLLLQKGLSPNDLSSTSSLDAFGGNPFVETGLSGKLLSKAQLTFNPTTGEPEVTVKFNAEGEKLFADITRDHTGEYLGIFLDGGLMSIPVIRQEIKGGEAQITGGFAVDEAKALVRNLNYGALPVPIEIISSETIGASLGDKAVTAGVMAGIWGFAFVALFLVLWYRLPGLVSVLALSLYVVIMLVAFKLIPVVLTAAGIAAFILSIGMAVDANILIFERMKEELKSGKKLGESMQEGFARAWPSIRDSNTSSMITAVILYWLGTSAVIKGFALVFFIGVLASMFTAITASRLYLYSLGLNMEKRGGIINFLFGSGFSK